jgi:hypothetical protein
VSYDLAVFDPGAAPRTRAEFDEWYDAITEWEDSHGYNNPEITTPALRAWFFEMIDTFPAMNGPYAKPFNPDDESRKTSDYSVDRHLIYVAFSWSMAEHAYDTCFRLAAKHGIGFLDASGEEGAAWFPDGQGGFSIAHKHEGNA